MRSFARFSFPVVNVSTSLFILAPLVRHTKGAQQVARRTIHDERIRQKQLLLETQKMFEEKERGLVAKLELAEESWKAER